MEASCRLRRITKWAASKSCWCRFLASSVVRTAVLGKYVLDASADLAAAGAAGSAGSATTAATSTTTTATVVLTRPLRLWTTTSTMRSNSSRASFGGATAATSQASNSAPKVRFFDRSHHEPFWSMHGGSLPQHHYYLLSCARFSPACEEQLDWDR